MESVDPENLYKRDPPAFGHELLRYFPLDPNYINLNHGSYGIAPYVVHKVANDLNFKLEANPDKFLRFDYLQYLNDVRGQLAEMVNVKCDEIVLVPNASVAINTILRNFEWEKVSSACTFTVNTTYNSIHKTVYSLQDKFPHPLVSEVQLSFPLKPKQITDLFRNHVKALTKHKGKKRVAVIDSIVSNPGVLMPWKELVKICKEEGIWSVIDAAHSIGQEQNIDLTEAAPDFWTSNCHKWLHPKRAVAMLYIPERNRNIIKTSLPTSHAYKPVAERTLEDFLGQWEWNGTIDWIPFLVVGAALDFRKWIGGEAKIFEYCSNLALEGGKRMADIFGTQVFNSNGELNLNMVNIELPFPPTISWNPKIDMMFKEKMLKERNAYSAHFFHNGHWWTRCSAQVYNQIEDFEELAKIWIEVCNEVKQQIMSE